MSIVVVVIVVILIPIMLSFPAVISRVPPLVILIPATLSFSVQIAPPFLGLVAVFTMFFDGSVESRFRLFDCMLAPRSIVISMRPWRGCKKPKRPCHYRCHCCLSKSSVQDFSFRFASG